MSSSCTHEASFQDSVNCYLRTLFIAALKGDKTGGATASHVCDKHPDWSQGLKADLLRAAKVLAAAWQFPGTDGIIPLSWFRPFDELFARQFLSIGTPKISVHR